MLIDEEDKKKKPKSFKEFDPKQYINTEPTLDEAAKGTAVISFGRMNPVTVGHEKLVNRVLQVAAKAKASPLVYLSHSEDPKKNPLSYSDKVRFAQKAFGRVIQKSKARTIIEVAKELSGKFANLIVVVGSDRVKEFETLLKKYNGKEYNFQVIDVQSAGERDPDADGVEGMSASKMRALAADNDLNQFKKGLPKKLQRDAESVLDSVRKGMKMAEEYEELEEALSRAQRRKRSIAMRRARSKIRIGREKAKRRRASHDKLEKRSKRKAVQMFQNKFAKHKRYADMEPSEKERIERRIAKIPKERLARIAKKMLIQVKKDERAKFSKMATDNPTTLQRESFIQFVESTSTKPQDPDVKDRPGSQPKGYYKGVDKDKKDARAAHFERGAKMSDDNPSAYKPAPGDAEAKTKPSKHTKKYKQMFGEELEWVCGGCYADPCVCEGDGAELSEMWGAYVTKKPHMLMDKNNKVKFDKRFKMYKNKDKNLEEDFGSIEDLVDLIESTEEYMADLDENAKAGLKKKAEKSGMPYSILKKVYDRGVAAWRTGHRPGTTPEQWGYARVNSFVTKSSGTWGKADKDLAAKVRKEEMDINDKVEAFLESKQVDEVLDTPKAMDSYKNKAKASYDRAAKSAAAKILRGKDKDGNRADHRPELKTMAKRKKGLTGADMVAVRRTFDNLRKESVDHKIAKFSTFLEKSDEYEKERRAAIRKAAKGGDVDTRPEIDEISKDLAQRYYTKSTDQQKTAMSDMKKSKGAEKDAARDKFVKRAKGANMAFNRLMKKEESGAGEEGTNRLVNKYKKDTPCSESFNVKEAFSKALKEAKTLRLLPMRVNRGGESNAKMLADEINDTFTKSNIKMRAIKIGKTWHVEGEGDNPTKLAQIVKFLGANGVGHGQVDDQPEIRGGKIPDAAHMKKIDKAIKDLRASHPNARGHDNINFSLEDMKKKLITKEMAYTELDSFLGRIGVIKSLQPYIKKSDVFQQWLDDK